MLDTQPVLVCPFDDVIGNFCFTSSPRFMENQHSIFAAFQDAIIKKADEANGIDLPRLVIKKRAENNTQPLVIDVRTEPLLFSVGADNVAFLLNESNDLSLLATYTESLINAVHKVLGQRTFVRFEIRSKQIVDLDTKNSNLMDQLLPGITDARGAIPACSLRQPRVLQGATQRCQVDGVRRQSVRVHF